MNRPYLVRFISCRNVRVEGVALRNSVMRVQHYLDCDFVALRALTVYSHVAGNNDMIDIDSCRNVVVADCIGDTSDDAITLKSTSTRGALKRPESASTFRFKAVCTTCTVVNHVFYITNRHAKYILHLSTTWRVASSSHDAVILSLT